MKDDGLIEAKLEDLRPNTFIAVDTTDPEKDDTPVRFVGTFIRWTVDEPQSLIMVDVTDNNTIDILRYAISAVWFAPMGYRP